MARLTKLERIGTVTLRLRDATLELAYTYQGKRCSISLGSDSRDARKAARVLAQSISSDIALGLYDISKAKYHHKYRKPIKETPKLNLSELWQHYKTKLDCSETTKISSIRSVDLALTKCGLADLTLDEINQDSIIAALRTQYTESSTELRLTYLIACLNLAVEEKLIDYNPLVGIKKKLSKEYRASKSKAKVEFYSFKEVLIIVDAFRNNTYNKPKATVNPSHYADFVLFRALTGLRIEEAIALTWQDIDYGNKPQIRINKAYSLGILKSTKTYKDRFIPINDQLRRLIDSFKPNHQIFPDDLVFSNDIPTDKRANYISSYRFNQQFWVPIIAELVKDKKLPKQLTFYSLRHTFASELLAKNIDIVTIAQLLGDNKETAIKHYLGARQDFTLPSL